MATTEQRSGFRLPWASEPRTGAAGSGAAGSGAAGSGAAGSDAAGSDAARSDAAGSDAAPVTDLDGSTATASGEARTAPWPTSDAIPDPGSMSESAAETTAGVQAMPRPANPLVAGLVRAMRDAAEAARQEALAKVDEAAKVRREEIQAESAETSAEIRRASDHDIAEIREWSKAQMARLREETDERIAARRRRLELESEDHAARLAHRIEHIQDSVGAFEARMEAFFGTLLAEEDPARLAGFAEQMPEPPDLTDEQGLADWVPSRTLDSDDAAAAEAAALSDFDLADAFEPGEVDAVPGTLPTDPSGDGDGSQVTRLSVVGLVSVASISGFKRAVARTPGIESISVAAGPEGEFLFTVRHAPDVDFISVVGGLDGFSASMTNDEDGVLSVTASQPAGLG
ncbi:MAG: hypothetical protein V4515_11225 [Chloroflexota bacterium]